MKNILLPLLITVCLSAQAKTYTVVNTLDDGAGSLRQAILDANQHAGEDTISVDKAVTGSIMLKSELTVSDTLIINGNHLTIDASKASRIFLVHKPLTLRGLTLTNGSGNSSFERGNGGAIYALAPLQVEESTISHNFTDDSRLGGSRGGAIYAEQAITIINSKLDHNRAETSGGAIYVKSGEVKLENSTFSENSASSYGGAMTIADNQGINIRHITFEQNKAGKNGGALQVDKFIGDASATHTADVPITIADSLFIHNETTETPSDGGALHLSLTVDNSFDEGKANTFRLQAPVTITNSLFKQNKTTGSGGALYINASTLTEFNDSNAYTHVPLNISASTFDHNSATRGGAIYTSTYVKIYEETANEGKATAPLTLTNSTLSNNTADKLGGAIYTWAKVFPGDKNNKSKAYANSAVTLVNSTLTQNSATEKAGAILFRATQWGPSDLGALTLTLTAQDSILLGNTERGNANNCNKEEGNIHIVDAGNNLLDVACREKISRKKFEEIPEHAGVTFANTLEPLADNDCITPAGSQDTAKCITTHALKADSIAVNQGTANNSNKDQRGFTRDTQPDIGAFEWGAKKPTTPDGFADSFE